MSFTRPNFLVTGPVLVVIAALSFAALPIQPACADHGLTGLTIHVSDTAPALERQAAAELAERIGALYGVTPKITSALPAQVVPTLLVGSPATNPIIKRLADKAWPKTLSPQGIVVRTMGQTVPAGTLHVIGGSTPQSTYWAAHEFLHHLGVRAFLHGDVPPLDIADWSTTAKLDLVLEPDQTLRGFELLGDAPASLELWSLAEQKTLLTQFAKLKYNHVVLSLKPWHPVIARDVAGVEPRAGLLGGRFRVDGDTGGRRAFGGLVEFGNADFLKPGAEPVATGQQLVTGLIDAAHAFGMTVSLRFPLLEFRAAAGPVLGKATEPIGTQGVRLKPDMAKGDAFNAAKSQFAAYVAAFPDADGIWLDLPGDSATAMAAVAVAGRIATDSVLPRRRDGSSPRGFVLAADAQPQGLPAGELVIRAATPSQPGVLPRLLPTQVHTIETQGAGRAHGFVVRTESPGEQTPVVYARSRQSFTPKLSDAEARQMLWSSLLSPAAAERVLKGLAFADEAVALIHKHDPRFSVAAPALITKHEATSAANAAWWKDASKLYGQAMDEMYRGIQGTRQGATRPVLLYHAKHFEGAVHTFTCLEAVRAAAEAKQMKKADLSAEQLEKATEAIYNALTALGDVSHDATDRGTIAWLNQYGYKVLQKRLSE